MNLLFNLFVFTLLSFLIGKPIIPFGDEQSVLLVNINDKGKNYTYYDLDKSGLDYSDIGDFSSKDSVRIKFYIREVVAEGKKEKQNFKVDLVLNNKTKTLHYKDKANSKHSLKNRPGWSVTEPGIWFVDILYSDLEKLLFSKAKKSKDKLIIRSVVKKINRKKMVPRTLSTINKENRYRMDTRVGKGPKEDTSNSYRTTYWYRLSNNSDELQFEAEGPTSIRIFSRISNPAQNSKNNEYSIFVKEDGLDIGTFYFSTELSSQSYLSSTQEKVSKWRTCWINVPKGKHYYTVRKGIFSSREFEFEANAIQSGAYNMDNPIYIRVKRYDEK